ncbi:TraR/DksA family transcriptional regulator [Actinacidiphila yeochonensis]|uniref:TraR/DksA family transcriptional regulator n=1 Tax=Actinacidiphila yeochonensis TaxID=89050 RepID=UPI00056C5AE7|nr:TraR/DksA C4-type zinc finger protein [Actinacidiphila yeochonensis]
MDAEPAASRQPSPDGEAVRVRLAVERASEQARIEALSREFDGIVAAGALVAVDDEHDPEGSSTAFERAHVASLLDQSRDRLAALDRAAERLAEGTYARCERCAGPIPAERLEALPATTLCFGCASAGPR